MLIVETFLYFSKYSNIVSTDYETTARMFKALGDPTRLKILEFLRGCCCGVAIGDEGDVRPADGPTVGEVCCRVTGAERITSTVSFHLKELRQAGLIATEKRGKHMLCCLDPEGLGRLEKYLGSFDERNACCEEK